MRRAIWMMVPPRRNGNVESMGFSFLPSRLLSVAASRASRRWYNSLYLTTSRRRRASLSSQIVKISSKIGSRFRVKRRWMYGRVLHRTSTLVFKGRKEGGGKDFHWPRWPFIRWSSTREEIINPYITLFFLWKKEKHDGIFCVSLIILMASAKPKRSHSSKSFLLFEFSWFFTFFFFFFLSF